MRLYLDDDTASPLIAKLLRNAAHDVQMPSEIGMSGAPDPVHLTRAQAARLACAQPFLEIFGRGTSDGQAVEPPQFGQTRHTTYRLAKLEGRFVSKPLIQHLENICLPRFQPAF